MQYICNINVFGDKNRNYFFIRFLYKEIKVNRRQTKDRTVHMCMCVFVEVCVMVFARTYDWLLHYVVKLKHCYHMYQSLTHNTVGSIVFIVICLPFCPHFVFQTFFVIFWRISNSVQLYNDALQMQYKKFTFDQQIFI